MARMKMMVVVLAVLGAVVLLVAGLPRLGAAQTASSAYSAISQGPGGVWVLRGNQLFICAQSPVRSEATLPATPQCGPPLRLP